MMFWEAVSRSLIWAIYTLKGGFLSKSFKHNMNLIDFEIYHDLWTIWFLQQARTNNWPLTFMPIRTRTLRLQPPPGNYRPAKDPENTTDEERMERRKVASLAGRVWLKLKNDGQHLFEGVFEGRHVTSCSLSKVWDMYSILVLIHCIYMYLYVRLKIIYIYIYPIYIYICIHTFYRCRFRERESIHMTVNMEACDTNFDPLIFLDSQVPVLLRPKDGTVGSVGGDEVWLSKLQNGN